MIVYNFYFIIAQLILLVPSFFIYRWIIGSIGLKPLKVYSLVCTILLPVLFTWIFININSEYIGPWIRSEIFNSQKWKADNKSRYRMVNDIIDNKLLIGKTREEIFVLLGNDAEVEEQGEYSIGYSTNDPDQWISIDHEVLEIVFDSKNKVSSVKINLW